MALEQAVALDATEVCGEAALLLGNLDFERGAFDGATEWYTTAARHFESAGTPLELARVYNNLGLVAWRLRDLPRAEAHFDQALRAYGPDADARIRGNLHNNLGLVYEDSGDPSAAEAAYRRAIELLRGMGDNQYLGNALANLGDLLMARREHIPARKLQEEALAARLRVGHLRGVATSRVALGRIAFELGEYEVCERETTQALALARDMGLRQQEADSLALQARLSERNGDYLGALRDERAAAALREQVYGEQMTERVAALQLRFDAWQARLQARRAEEERARLATTMVEVRAASEARARFLAMMSHELRTPLTSAIGAAELLRLGDIDPRQRRLVDVIVASSEALLAAIGDVLDLARAEQDRLELVAESVAPRQLAEQVLAIVSPTADARGLTVALTVADDVPAYVSADPARLRQVLLNLVANAVKFTERGRVDVRLSREGELLRFDVEDTGIGIPPEFAARVFEPFTQADTSRTRRYGGSGLGLTIARRIVDAMGGTIQFRSTVGAGSTFTVRLNLPAAPAPGFSTPSSVATRFTALLVEDDDSVREVVADLLGFCGAEVTSASSGFEALERFAGCPTDLVVLDIHMPGMDGLTVARHLRERYGDTVRILGLSGATGASDRAAASDAGFDGWLPKPTPLRRLRAEIERLGLRTPG